MRLSKSFSFAEISKVSGKLPHRNVFQCTGELKSMDDFDDNFIIWGWIDPFGGLLWDFNI